ncbi:hypothetical protein BpHYR1_010268 [Brachionus plicatilis]|uniref:Uncharacterized protein n=1 Tax=Brachionus plicatilis TaxID=10195 RepID=A0A3M7SMQ8_BRAPC|nr:hypothetical protein BpHYR1_010268 [Brachionus plicatilis]
MNNFFLIFYLSTKPYRYFLNHIPIQYLKLVRIRSAKIICPFIWLNGRSTIAFFFFPLVLSNPLLKNLLYSFGSICEISVPLYTNSIECHQFHFHNFLSFLHQHQTVSRWTSLQPSHPNHIRSHPLPLQPLQKDSSNAPHELLEVFPIGRQLISLLWK